MSQLKSNKYKWLDTPEDHESWGVKVQKSKLPKLKDQLGLFATKTFRKDEKIIPYLGEELTLAQRKYRYGDKWGAYIYFKPYGHPSIDAQFYRGAGAFANDGKWDIKSDGSYRKAKSNKANTRLERGWLVANKQIRKNQEILLDYGEQYWKRRYEGIPRKGKWKPKLLKPKDFEKQKDFEKPKGKRKEKGKGKGKGKLKFDQKIIKLTPIESKAKSDYSFKRDDLFSIYGAKGGKARTCYALILNHKANSKTKLKGLITGGSRSSPQVEIVAKIATGLKLPARLHMPKGELPDFITDATRNHQIFQWFPGFNHVLSYKATQDAKANKGWLEIPFGMETQLAVDLTAHQVKNIPVKTKRIVVPVGSGMTLAGILVGIKKQQKIKKSFNPKVLGIIVGADPTKRLDEYAPKGWRTICKLKKSKVNYHKAGKIKELDGVPLDPIYEAKVVPFLRKGDLVWIVGRRG